MTQHMIMADFKTSTGWANNAFIFNDLLDNLMDKTIVKCIEKSVSEEKNTIAKCVFFIELYGDILTVDQLREMQDDGMNPNWKGRVSRMVIADEDLFQEWLKPEGVVS